MCSMSSLNFPHFINLAQIQSQLSLVDIFKASQILDLLGQFPTWVWVGTSCVGAAVCFKLYYDQVFQVWKKQGVPGPTPVPVFGNSHLAAFSKGGIHKVNIDLFKEFGQLGYIGTFTGTRPTLLIADPDLICDVMIKQFDVFPNRLGLKGFSPKYLRKSVFILRDTEWKKVRNYLTPTFTGMKLKKMVPLISEMGSHLCDKFEQAMQTQSQEFKLKPMYRACTMDIIANIVFGICADSQSGENRVAQTCIKQIEENEKLILHVTLLSFFAPVVAKIYGLFSPSLGLNLEASHVTADFLLQIIKKRQEGHAESEKTFFLNTLVEKLELHAETKGKEGMDFETTVAQALIFMLAGFDTTANLMMWASYYLAIYPDLQDSVYEEIASLAGPNGEDANYDTVNKMHLLENVLFETLRFRPIFRIQREAAADTVLCNGIKIKKGWVIEVPLNVVHMDPKIWKDPQNFRPSRFEPEEANGRSPYAFNSFGLGPRNCVGMRLALFEVKMAFVKILSKYRLSRARNTPDEITEFTSQQFYDPADPLFLKVSRR